MATAYINQERFGVEFEDRINKLVNVDPDETVFTSMVQKSEASRNRVDWQTHVLDASNKDNAGVDGADVTNATADYTAPTSLFNYTQIPQRPFGASFSYDAINKPGMGSGNKSGFDNEKVRKSKVLKKDMEAMMLSSNDRVQPLPETTQAGKLRGVQQWITTNVIDARSPKYGSPVFSSKMFFDLAQQCVDAGGMPETVFANSKARMRINEFVGPPTRDIDSLGRKIMHMVDIIQSIAGPQQIVFARELKDSAGLQTVLLMLEMKYWEQRWLRAPQSYIKGLAGSRTDAWIESEITLVAWAEKTSGKNTNMS